MNRFATLGGIVASLILIGFGAASLIMGISARTEVRNSLAAEQIKGTPDSEYPGKLINTGAKAKSFAGTMRKHTLEMTGEKTYAEMGRFVDADGNDTDDEKAAAKDATGQPVANTKRDIWVTSTALTTALNMAFFAENVALFSIMMGIALILTGIGFMVLTIGMRKVPHSA